MARQRFNNLGQSSVAWPRAGRGSGGRGARRSGIASLIAMLYLVIFSALAVGFYAAVTTASQLAHNDEKAMNAQIAAECGMQFIRFQLDQVRVPGNTPPNQVMQEVLNDLLAQQATTANIAGRGITLSGNTIYFPTGTTEFVALDTKGAGFRAEMIDDGDGLLRVKVQGRYRGTAIMRTIQMHFEPVFSSTSVFDFGVVNRGPITVNGGGLIGGGANAADGSILSMSQITNPITLTGTSGVAGDVYMTNPKGTVSIQGGGVSIAGSTVPAVRAQHIHAGVPDPELPIVDSGIFLPYVTDVYSPGRTEYRNVMIPANTNPTFSSDVAIKGVLYIKYPNKITFNGKTTITGTVVVENGAVPSTKNQISFGAGVEAKGMDTLPADADFPPTLRALRGSTLLAPGFAVSISGHSGSIGGIMLADSFTLSGSSGGVIDGTFVGLGEGMLTFTGGSSVARTKPSGPIPAGLVFSKKYKPIRKTYVEG